MKRKNKLKGLETQGGNNVTSPPLKTKDLDGKDQGLEKKKQPRWTGTRWLLTYNNLDQNMTHDVLESKLREKIPHFKKFLIGKEVCADEKRIHWHVWIHLQVAIDTKKCEWGWIDNCSCDYKKAKDYHAVEYAMKDMNYKTNTDGNFWCTSKNFRKEYADHTEWYDWERARTRLPVSWPLLLPDGELMQRPDPKVKQRHRWYVAPVNWGKTDYLNSLGRLAAFIVCGAKYPLENFRNEELIIMNNVELPWDCIESLTDTHGQDEPCPGKQRYHQLKIYAGTSRNLIYLGNNRSVYINDPRWQARFLEVFLN